jgi:hypothetical protein
MTEGEIKRYEADPVSATHPHPTLALRLKDIRGRCRYVAEVEGTVDPEEPKGVDKNRISRYEHWMGV